MKKAFTLFLTLAFVLTVSASTGINPTKVGVKINKQAFDKQLTTASVKSVQPQKAHKIAKPFMKNGKEIALPNVKAERVPVAAVAANNHKAPRKADAEAIDITVDGGTLRFYSDTNDWWYGGTNAEQTLRISLDWYSTNADDPTGTFELSDMDTDYTYITDYTNQCDVQLTSLNVTCASDGNGGYTITGSVVGEDGNTYNINVTTTIYTPEPVEPEDIDIEGTELLSASYYEEDSDWYVRFQNSDYRVTLDFVSADGSFPGTYTIDDCLANYTYVYDINNSSTDKLASLDLTTSLPEGVTDPAVACEISATAVGESGNTYTIHFKQNPPLEPTEVKEIEVEVVDAQWPTEESGSYFKLVQKDDATQEWVLDLNNLTGDITEKKINLETSGLTNTATGETVAIDHGTISETFDSEAMKVSVEADLVLANAVEYKYSFDYAVEVAGEVSYEFDNLEVDESLASWGILFLAASNDEATLDVGLYADAFPGEMTEDDGYIALVIGEKEVSNLSIFEANSTNEDNCPTFTAKFLGDDLVVYTVNAVYTKPEVEEEIDVNIEGMEVTDLINDLGAWKISGYNEDESIYVSVVPSATQIPGHYTLSDLSDWSSYNYIAFIHEDGSYDLLKYVEADFDVTQEGDEVVLDGVFQAGTYKINMTLKGTVAPEEEEGLEYDAEDEGVDVAFTTADIVALEGSADDGYGFVRLVNAERNDMFSMLIYTTEFDDDVVFPAGEWEVNTSYEAPSVQPGEVSGSSVYPTFYGTMTDDGYINTPLWFLRSGTVTTSKSNAGELVFEVNGENSYHQPIHVTLNMDPTAIKNVNTDNTSVKKMIENKQVVIKKGDMKYTVVGQTIK